MLMNCEEVDVDRVVVVTRGVVLIGAGVLIGTTTDVWISDAGGGVILVV